MAEERTMIRRLGRGSDPPKTYEEIVTRFIMSLTHRMPEKLKEIQYVMSPEEDTSNMFSFVWGLEEAHVKMIPPVVKSKKSNKNSFIYWRLGNTHLSRNDKDLALKYFNLSIQVAPHPPIVVDDKIFESDVMEDWMEVSGDHFGSPSTEEPGRHDPEGWGDYVSLGYAYEARACLLFEMGQYGKCIRDVDAVLHLGCPNLIAEKLRGIRENCEEKITNPRGAATPSPIGLPTHLRTSQSPSQSSLSQSSLSQSSLSQSSLSQSSMSQGSPTQGSPGHGSPAHDSPAQGSPAREAAQSAPAHESSQVSPPQYSHPSDTTSPSKKTSLNVSSKRSSYKRTIPKTRADSPKAFKYNCPNPPAIVDADQTLPAFGDSVELSYSKQFGRFLAASKHIEHGDLLAVEEAFCSTVKLNYIRTYCSVCMRRTMAPLPCPSCSLVVFCSQRCRIKGLANIHWQECPILPTLVELDINTIPLLALKLLMKMNFVKLKDIVPHLKRESKHKPPPYKGLNDDDIYDPKDYKTVYNLLTHKDKRDYKYLMKIAMEAFLLVKLLQASDRFFKDSEGKDYKPTVPDLTLIGSLLMHHIMNFSCNSGGLFEMEIVGNELDKCPIRVYGAGIFPTISLMNHACYANCVVYCYHNYRVVRAARAIPVGTQLTCQYVDMINLDFKEQRAMLLSKYFFTCQCDACEKNWPDDLPNTTTFFLKCIRCGTAVTPGKRQCPLCSTEYKYSFPVVTKRGRTFDYNYGVIKKRIQQAIKEYKRAEHQLMKKGSRSESDMLMVNACIELFDDYVALPSYIHVAAQKTWTYLNYAYSSSFESIEDSNPQCKVS